MLGRLAATFLPNGTYTKVVSVSWVSESWDANDAVFSDPRTDATVSGLLAPFLASQATDFVMWYQRRIAASLGAEEAVATERAAAHAATPKVS
jgi:hypothetical protein